jgi:hypothetical protein
VKRSLTQATKILRASQTDPVTSQNALQSESRSSYGRERREKRKRLKGQKSGSQPGSSEREQARNGQSLLLLNGLTNWRYLKSGSNSTRFSQTS